MFTLPKLEYDYKDLEPYIDAETMLLHHTKHHQAYVDNLNKVLENNLDLQKLSLDELLVKCSDLPENIKQSVINNAGGHANHSFFWKVIHPPIVSSEGDLDSASKLMDAINTSFGNLESFKEQFAMKAMSVFGSGWCFLVVNSDKKLVLKRQSFQNAPQMQGNTPILGIDLWEHAYYLKYQNRKKEYIDAFWNVVNWKQVELNFIGSIR